ncbi:hypothetical protein C8F01DRAFT_1253771 [Mycena amicta]|nr:hypothetical protein C8F01DRAFT_1253771 [Mycena amicta]
MKTPKFDRGISGEVCSGINDSRAHPKPISYTFPKLTHLRLEAYVNEIPAQPTHFLQLQLRLVEVLAARPTQKLVSLMLHHVLAVPDKIYTQHDDFLGVIRRLKSLDDSVLYDLGFEGLLHPRPPHRLLEHEHSKLPPKCDFPHLRERPPGWTQSSAFFLGHTSFGTLSPSNGSASYPQILVPTSLPLSSDMRRHP